MTDRLANHAEVTALEGHGYRLRDRYLGKVPTDAHSGPADPKVVNFQPSEGPISAARAPLTPSASSVAHELHRSPMMPPCPPSGGCWDPSSSGWCGSVLVRKPPRVLSRLGTGLRQEPATWGATPPAGSRMVEASGSQRPHNLHCSASGNASWAKIPQNGRTPCRLSQ
jgi:hypothetical protein